MLKIAHRGAVAYAPENTLAAFHRALEAHVDMIELDVRLCKTGEPIVIHDPTVDRTTNGKGKVKDLSLEEIKRLHIKHTQQEKIPTLEEVLHVLAGKTIINIDIKTRAAVQPVTNLLHTYIKQGKLSYNTVILASGNILTLRDVYRKDPLFLLSVILRYFPTLVVRLSARFKPFSVQPLSKITTKKLVTHLHKKDIKVFPWALKTLDDDMHFLRKMKKMGIDGIISFFPERFSEKTRNYEKKK